MSLGPVQVAVSGSRVGAGAGAGASERQVGTATRVATAPLERAREMNETDHGLTD